MTKVLFKPIIGERGFENFFDEFTHDIEFPLKGFPGLMWLMMKNQSD